MNRTELEKKCLEVTQILKPILGKHTGFAVLLFDFGENGHLAYVSNSEREDMIRAMKEFIAKNETN